MKPWLFVYSASGIFQVMNYWLVVRKLMLALLADDDELEPDVHFVKDEKIQRVLNIYDKDRLI